jgi:hypothetical protein
LYRIRSVATGLHEETKSPVPEKFELLQNYPNPFNGSTKLLYTVSHTMTVQLRVYDSAGHLVKTLVHETKDAGHYSATFDASTMASGVYFASLVSDTDQKSSLFQSMKLTLIR